ncbi:MAG: ornithine carbamoyltransferase [Planctomycetia bacterium]|nr:ornithine carbamoyltransferase [Planctomycetia bacterium]
MRHFLDLLDVSKEEVKRLLTATAALKSQTRAEFLPLAGHCLGLVFEKPSLRTRVSFQAAMGQLGGTSIFLSGADAGLGTREPLSDYARVMTSYVDALVVRTFHHATVEGFARYAECPVINGLSDYYHPCQALADVFTISEHFRSMDQRTVVFVGDGNNVARSLAVACAYLNWKFRLVCPASYVFDEPFVKTYQQKFPKLPCEILHDPIQAMQGADVVYTDVWTSMGQEQEALERKQQFQGFQVNAGLLKNAPKHAVVMHCLPAHRGEEIAADAVDSDQSIVFTQAANRLHLQKALLLWLLIPDLLPVK